MMLKDMVTKGHFVDPQISRISENTFKFPFIIVLTLLAHEMVQVAQKTTKPFVVNKNKRKWKAYYKILFHQISQKIPLISNTI